MNASSSSFLAGARIPGILFTALTIFTTPVIAADPDDLLADNTDGNYGYYLKEVGGPVLANLNEGDIFEPASSIKVIIHLHGMLEVEAGNRTLGESVPWLANPGKFDGMGNYICGGNDCYATNTIPMSDTYQESLRLMMECSDNALTQALRDLLGDANILDTAYNVVGLNMTKTQLNHSIGCGAEAAADHNRFNLVDIGVLHEYVALSGALNPNNRQTFYDLMVNSRFFDTVIAQEAALLGMTDTQIGDYRSLVEVATKGGSYGLSDGLYRSIGGWARLPFPCENTEVEYVFGAFIDGATTLDLMNTGNNLSIGTVMAEVMRDEIAASLESFYCGLPPVLDLPDNLEIECPGSDGVPGDDPEVLAWLASASAMDECGLVSFTHSDLPAMLPVSCASGTLITFTAVDDCGMVTEDSRLIRIVDTTPPEITPPEPLVIECNSSGGVSGDDPAIQAWYDSVVIEDLCSHIPVSGHTAPDFFSSNCPPGVPVVITFSATDQCGNSAEANSTITVVDTTPPELNCTVATPVLWAPNHMLVDVGLSIDVNDACDESPIVSIAVTSDEAPSGESGSGGPIHCPDAVIGVDNSVLLRAERAGNGDGRVYAITVTAVDSCGNASNCTVNVVVPHNNNSGAADSGQLFNPTLCP